MPRDRHLWPTFAGVAVLLGGCLAYSEACVQTEADRADKLQARVAQLDAEVLSTRSQLDAARREAVRPWTPLPGADRERIPATDLPLP